MSFTAGRFEAASSRAHSLPAYALDVVAHDDSLLLVAVSGLQRHPFALVVAAVHVLRYLSLVLAYQTVGRLHDELRGAVVLLQLEEPRMGIHLLEV